MTKNGPQLTSRKPLEVAIVCYPGSQATSIHGLTDLFTYADSYAREQASSACPFVRITHWKPSGEGFECAFESCTGDERPPAVVIVPGAQVAPIERGGVPECVAWIRRKHSEGAVIAAVCGGVFVLAESGLLSGRRTTTHWLFADVLRRRYPELKVDADRLVIDDNDIVTAGDTVDQIAVATGYEDPGGFRRTFKRVVGLSPSEYRRRFQRQA